MIKTKRLRPYDNKGNIIFTKKTCGTYLIYKDDILRYVGFSKNNVYRTLYRHFQQWKTSVQVRTTYTNLKGITVEVFYTNTPLQADRLEKAIIINRKPIDNPNKYLQYTTDKQEDKIFDLYTNEPAKDIVKNNKYSDEEPF
jgi:hypothetical protein